MMGPEHGTGNDSSRIWKWSLRLGVSVALALGWEFLAHRVNSLLVPTFTETLAALVRLLMTSQLWGALWISNQAMALGFGLAAITGIGLGFLMGRWRAAERFSEPYLSILLVTPMSAVIPIIIMATGLGLLSRVMIVFSFAFVTIAINTRAGVRMVEPSWIEMTRAFGATERQLWFTTLLRGARPAILMGLRLGLIRAVAGMITMELLLIAVGVGRLILDFQGYFEAAEMYAVVIVVIAEAVILTQLCHRLELRATPWAEQVVVE
jgi:ABC-type nitrate/sulfonate/bicarbonate transport system permease component